MVAKVDSESPMDDEILVWVGILASLIGLLEFARRMILESQNQRHQVKKIISGFGVIWLKDEVNELKEICSKIDHRQNEHIKAGIDRIEKVLEKITYD